jgi:hypothetical protein
MMIDQRFFTIIGILYTFFAFITILFSLTVIIIIVYYWRIKCRSIPNLLTAHSSLALLFYAITFLTQIPFVFQSDPLHPDQMETTFCRVRAFLNTYATLVKAYSYLVMAVSCFFITILYKHRILLSYRTNFIIIVISWICSGIITGGTFLVPAAYGYELEAGLCFLRIKHFATSFTVVTLVVMINLGVMISLYGIIIWHITRYSRINPHSGSTLRAKRNVQVYRKIFIFVGILVTAGTPYFLCSILHQVNLAPWPLYAVAHLFIVFSAALESIALLFTNEQVRTILFDHLCCRQVNLSNTTAMMTVNRATQIVPVHNNGYTIQSMSPVG